MANEERLPGLVIDIEARINKLEQGLKRATEKQRKAADEMENRARKSAKVINDAYANVGDGAKRGFSGIADTFKSNSYRIGGVATQFGDLATQIGGGTSALKAFGMQAGQMGGYFGPMGMMAGAAAAAILPLAAAFLKGGDEAGTLEDRLNTLTNSTGDLETAVATAAIPIEELRLKYKDLADEIQRANGIAAVFAIEIGKRDVLSAAKGLGNGLTIPTATLIFPSNGMARSTLIAPGSRQTSTAKPSNI